MSAVASAAPARAAVPRPWGRWGLRATAISYLGLFVALPVAAVVASGLSDGIAGFWTEISSPIAWQALRLTLVAAAIMTLVNAVMGTLTAYVLVRFDFPGRRVLDAVVDLPFAIPTLATGVMIVVLYGPQGALGGFLESRGVRVLFEKPAILLALLVVCYPFVIRAVQPVLMGVERSREEAAATLGASAWTTFRRVVLPAIRPSLLTGSLLAFARALGEFGSIVVVAGNIPGRTLTAPVYVFGQIESQNERGASAVSVVLLALSFGLLLILDVIGRRRAGQHG